MSSETIIICFDNLFTLFGTPGFVHSDNAKTFVSNELKLYLQKRGVATSRSSIYHPIGNSQLKRLNGTVWHSVRLALRSKDCPINRWEVCIT